jgi:hypothetical protein
MLVTYRKVAYNKTSATEIIMQSVKELQAALEAAKAAEKEQGNAAWKQLDGTLKHVWSVKWLDKYSVDISCRYDDESLARIEQLDKLYPSSSYRIYEDARRNKGMTYMLVNNVLIQSGGGWVVLNIERNNIFRSWRELTPEQVQALRDGKVPDELKVKQFK